METIVFPLPGRVTIKEPTISSTSTSDNQIVSYNVISSRLLPAGTILQYEFNQKDSKENFHVNYNLSPVFTDNQQSVSCNLNSGSERESDSPNDSVKAIASLDVDPFKVTDQPDSDSESFIVLDIETSVEDTLSDQDNVENKRPTFFSNGVERFKKIGLTTTSILKTLASNFHKNQPEPLVRASDSNQSTSLLTTGHFPVNEQADDPEDTKQIISKSNRLEEIERDGTKKLTESERQKGKQITKDTVDDHQPDELPNVHEVNKPEGHEKGKITSESDKDLVNQLIEFIEAAIIESSNEQLTENRKDEKSINKSDDSFRSKRKDSPVNLCPDGEKGKSDDQENDQVSIVALKIHADDSENDDPSHTPDSTKLNQPTLPINNSSDCTDVSPQEEDTIQPESKRSTRSNECTYVEPDQGQDLSTPLSSPEIMDHHPSCPTINQPESITMAEYTFDKEETQSTNEPKSQPSSSLTNEPPENLKNASIIMIPVPSCEGIEKRRLDEDESLSSCENQMKKRRLANGLDVSGMNIRAALTVVMIENGWKQDGERTNRIFQSVYECHGRNQDKIIEIAIEKNCIKIYTNDRETRLILLRELQEINTVVKETSPFQLYVQNPLKPSIQFLVHDSVYNLTCSELISQIRKWNSWDDAWTVHIESKEWIRKIRKGKISLIVDSRIRDKLEIDDLIIKIGNDPVKVFDKFGISQCSVCLRFGHSKCRSRIRCFFCSGLHQDKVRHDKYTEQRYCFLCRVNGHTPIAKNCPSLIEEIQSKLELIDYEYSDIFLGNDRSY